MIKQFSEFISEASFTKADIPSKFYVCIRLKPETFEQLAKGELPGVEGISSRKDNFSYWLRFRDAMLVMDSDELLNNNKLSRVMYDNKHYIASDNLKNISRLFGKQSKEGAVYQLVREFLNYVRNRRNFTDTYAMIAGRTNFDEGHNLKKGLEAMNIHGVKDIVNGLIKALNKHYSRYEVIHWDVKDIEEAVENTVLKLGQTYSHEGEWLVKDKVLRIPKGTMLYIPKDGNNDMYDELIESSGIESLYKIIRYKRRAVEVHGNNFQVKQYSKTTKNQDAIIAERDILRSKLEEAKVKFFKEELENYCSFFSKPEYELPLSLQEKIRKTVTPLWEKHYTNKPLEEITYISGWEIKDHVKDAVLDWIDKMDFANWYAPARKAFDEVDDSEDVWYDMNKKMYTLIRKDWHTLHPDSYPNFYRPY